MREVQGTIAGAKDQVVGSKGERTLCEKVTLFLPGTPARPRAHSPPHYKQNLCPGTAPTAGLPPPPPSLLLPARPARTAGSIRRCLAPSHSGRAHA